MAGNLFCFGLARFTFQNCGSIWGSHEKQRPEKNHDVPACKVETLQIFADVTSRPIKTCVCFLPHTPTRNYLIWSLKKSQQNCVGEGNQQPVDVQPLKSIHEKLKHKGIETQPNVNRLKPRMGLIWFYTRRNCGFLFGSCAAVSVAKSIRWIFSLSHPGIHTRNSNIHQFSSLPVQKMLKFLLFHLVLTLRVVRIFVLSFTLFICLQNKWWLCHLRLNSLICDLRLKD